MTLKLSKPLYAVVLAMLFILTATAQIDRTKQPEPGPAPKISLKTPGEFELSNGMKVLIVEDRKLPRVSFNLTIDNDPIFEGDKAGISGILGAMLGNGTTTISKDAFNEEVDFLGARMSFSASGGFASGLSKYADRIMELMAEAVKLPLLTEDEFNKEIERQIEALKVNEKDVETVSGRVGRVLSYGTHHPFGEYITEETLKNITLNNVNAFYQKYFNPNNAYLVIIGDVDFVTMEQKVKTHFGNWAKGAEVSATMPAANPNVQYTQINFIDMPNAVQSNIILTNNVQLKMSDEDYHATLLANYILGGGSSSKLYKNLREDKGYTYGSYSSVGTSKYVSRFIATAEVRNEVTDSAVVEMLKEVNSLKTQLVSDEELADAKAKYVGNFVIATEQPATLARYALNIRINELPKDFYTTYLEKINAVTVEDIQRVANKYFKPENARIIVVGQGSSVLSNLEKTGIPIKYFDTYGKPTAKPEYSKPIPEGVTAESVVADYLAAIGGTDNIAKVNSVWATADVTIEGAPFAPKAEIKQMTPNKESIEMSIEGMGTLMKQKFNGETGYIEQQGQKIPMDDAQVSRQKISRSIVPEFYYKEGYSISLESLTTIDGKDVYKIKVERDGQNTMRYYDVETKLLRRVERTVKQGDQEITSVVDYDKYSAVNGVMFPYYQIVKSGPQTLIFNYNNIKVNEGVGDADFN